MHANPYFSGLPIAGQLMSICIFNPESHFISLPFSLWLILMTGSEHRFQFNIGIINKNYRPKLARRNRDDSLSRIHQDRRRIE